MLNDTLISKLPLELVTIYKSKSRKFISDKSIKKKMKWCVRQIRNDVKDKGTDKYPLNMSGPYKYKDLPLIPKFDGFNLL